MAALHGRDLLERGFTLEQVVRDYGDLCQAVTNLAYLKGESIEVDEFRTFNRRNPAECGYGDARGGGWEFAAERV
jgi:hypothetical protein